MIELYAITDHPGPPLPDTPSLTAVAADGLAVVCAPAGGQEVTPDALWRHEEVVETLMRDRDLLPVRFGTRLDDTRTAARAVHKRRDELQSALDRVRGAVELSLRVVGSNGTAGDEASSGADYMRRKGRSASQRQAVLSTLHEPLSIVARVSRETPPRSPSELLRAAYLVDRQAVDSFVGMVRRLQQMTPHLRLLCTGPWPPYSFATA